MLQQTQVDRVIPKYLEFIDRFPTMADLAAASPADVLRAWSPLGYNLRALRLHRLAVEVQRRHGGRLPDDLESLRALPGLGEYTARAVACFGFGQPAAVVDTNVRRVLGRLFYHPDDTRAAQPALTAGQAQRLADAALPPEQAGDWNQALMDLGATICVARTPRCLLCPAQRLCGALAHGALPRPTARAAEPRPRYDTAPFPQSDRFFRGRIVAALRALPRGEWLPVTALRQQLPPNADPGPARLTALLDGLARDGLVEREGSPGQEKIRLPH